jgi:hypothetical protein
VQPVLEPLLANSATTSVLRGALLTGAVLAIWSLGSALHRRYRD